MKSVNVIGVKYAACNCVLGFRIYYNVTACIEAVLFGLFLLRLWSAFQRYMTTLQGVHRITALYIESTVAQGGFWFSSVVISPNDPSYWARCSAMWLLVLITFPSSSYYLCLL